MFFEVKEYELLNKEVYLNCERYNFKLEEPYLIASNKSKIIAGVVKDFKELHDCIVQITIATIDCELKIINLDFDNIAIKNGFIGILRYKLYQFEDAKKKAQNMQFE